MKKSIYLSIYLFIYLSISLNGQSINSQVIDEKTSIQRNATYNLEEIKVRWKKAALENCPGVPCVTAPSFTCGTSTMTDKDNNTYSTVSIGAQCWTTTNLKVTRYDDGSLIGDSTTSTWGTALIGARTGYDVSVVPLTDYVGTFGFLYNWYAVNDLRKLCPAGWHVPTDAEWTTLETYLNTVAPTGSVGGKMKSTGTNSTSGSGLGWDPGSPGNNTSGFSALPGGYRNYDGSFLTIRNIAFFWSTTGLGPIARARFLSNLDGNLVSINSDKLLGASVRCLRD